MIRKTQSAFIVMVVAISLMGAALLSACGQTCDVEQYIESVTPALTTWGQTVELAKSTPRLALTQQIEKLQEVRDQVSGMEVQSCLEEEHKLLIQAMDDQINGFISFLRQEPEAKFSAYFESSDENLQKWRDAVVHK